MEATFAVKMIDRLTGPARAMERALKAVRMAQRTAEMATRANQIAATQAGAAYERAGARAVVGARRFERAAQAIRSANRAVSVASVRHGFLTPGAVARNGPSGWFKGGGLVTGQQYGPVLDRSAQGFSLAQRASHAFGDGARGIMRWNTAMGSAIGKWAQMAGAMRGTPIFAVLSTLTSWFGKFLSFVRDGIVKFTKFGALVGAIAAGAFVKATVQMAAFGESAKRALSYITGSDALGKREFASAVELSRQLGTSVEDTVSQYSKLRSMQFSAIEATGLVKLSNDLKTITGDATAAQRALTAMTQIKAKGRLQSEELVGQLAEAGVSTVLVYQQLEKMLGTNRKGVLSSLQKGAIDSETGLVAIVRALKQKYHVSEVGKISSGYANQTLGGAWEALKTAPGRMFLRIGESIDKGPLLSALRTMRQTIEGAFSSGNARRFVNTMTSGLTKLVPIVTSFFEGFGAGLDSISKALTFGKSANLASWAKEAGLGVANYFARVIDLTKKVIPIAAEAAKKIVEGLNINKVLDQIAAFNWKAFGQNLVLIASGLAEIVSLLGPAVFLARSVFEQGLLGYTPATEGKLTAANAKTMAERAAKPIGERTWWESFVANQIDAERYQQNQPTYEPTVGPLSMRSGNSAQDNRRFDTTINIEGGGSNARELGAALKDNWDKHMSQMVSLARNAG